MMNVSFFSPPSGERKKKKRCYSARLPGRFHEYLKEGEKKITAICCYQQLKILYLITMEDVLFHNHL